MKSAKSIVSFFSIRSMIGVATAFVVVLAASLAQAASLTAVPPGFLSPVPAEADPGAAAQIATRSENFNGLGFSGVLVSNVYRGNQFGANALTFTYLLSNNAGSTNVLHRLTVSSFETFLTDVSIQAGGVPPTLADRSTPDVVGFSFLDGLGQGPIRGGGQSSLLVVETNSSVFTSSTASVIDGSTATVPTYAPFPAIPEPSTCALGILGVAGLIAVRRRTRQ